jgi:NADPH-dependent 7-cyano-7-deazaguanine reductase QueF
VLGAGVKYLMEEPAWLVIPPHMPAAESIARFWKLETPPNHFPGYAVTIRFPECTSVCPKTGLLDYGAITIEYEPRKFCLELKACKMHLLGYRSLGIRRILAARRIATSVEACSPGARDRLPARPRR